MAAQKRGGERGGARPGPDAAPAATSVAAQSGESLSSLAYDRIEDLIVHCVVAPGASVTTSALQAAVRLGRTPVHQAVRRLAAETLIVIRPRDGLQISPIDLQRDRGLLRLRRAMDRFAVELAAEKLDGNQRNRLLRLDAVMSERRDAMDVAEFNAYDRELDAIILAAADEPFLDRSLRPLHTVFRRVGNVHLTHVGGARGLAATIEHHLALLRPIADRNRRSAVAASDRLVDFADSMFAELEGRIEPRILDAALADPSRRPIVGA